MELDAIFARNEEVVSRTIVDELILVPIRKDVADMETLYTLNEVGRPRVRAHRRKTSP